MATDLKQLQTRLWDAADNLRANSGLKSSEYSTPVLGLIFLRYADHRFAAAHEELEAKGSGGARSARRLPGRAASSTCPTAPGSLTCSTCPRAPTSARPSTTRCGRSRTPTRTSTASCPEPTRRSPNDVLVELLRLLGRLPETLEGDAFGQIYEYFLGKFAMAEGQKGGEFFTPTSIVQLIVEIIEPFHGRIFDPACGSGGMFVQSAHFVERHHKDPGREIVDLRPGEDRGDGPPGQDEPRRPRPVRRHPRGQHYYEDLHDSGRQFDFVMANPPFNVDSVDKDKLEDDPRFPFGLPEARQRQLPLDPALLLGAERAAAGPASSWPTRPGDARGSELEIRRQLIEDRRGRRDGRDRLELLLHRHPALHALVPRQRQARHRARGPGAVHRRPPHLPPDRPRPPRLHARADRVPRQHRPALPGRGARVRRTAATPADASTSRTAPTSTSPACARSPPSPRSRPRAGASTPAATSALPPPATTTTSTSPRRSRS